MRILNSRLCSFSMTGTVLHSPFLWTFTIFLLTCLLIPVGYAVEDCSDLTDQMMLQWLNTVVPKHNGIVIEGDAFRSLGLKFNTANGAYFDLSNWSPAVIKELEKRLGMADGSLAGKDHIIFLRPNSSKLTMFHEWLHMIGVILKKAKTNENLEEIRVRNNILTGGFNNHITPNERGDMEKDIGHYSFKKVMEDLLGKSCVNGLCDNSSKVPKPCNGNKFTALLRQFINQQIVPRGRGVAAGLGYGALSLIPGLSEAASIYISIGGKTGLQILGNSALLYSGYAGYALIGMAPAMVSLAPFAISGALLPIMINDAKRNDLKVKSQFKAWEKQMHDGIKADEWSPRGQPTKPTFQGQPISEGLEQRLRLDPNNKALKALMEKADKGTCKKEIDW